MFWIGLLVALAIAMGVAIKLFGGSDQPSQKSPFDGVSLKAKPVINANEARVYEALLMAVPRGYLVFPSVRLIDLVSISATDNSSRTSATNRLWNKHVDFAIVRSSDRICAVVVEVDGQSHETTVQKKRDTVKDAALQQAGIRIVRIPRGDYSPAELAQLLSAKAPVQSANLRP